MEQTHMVRLATVGTGFHARVIAARLGADGIVTQLRGSLDGPYPMGDVHVYVGEDDLPDAAELLLLDDVESAFDLDADADADADADRMRTGGRARELWFVVASLLAITVTLFSRTA